jgi:hypothetical protein
MLPEALDCAMAFGATTALNAIVANASDRVRANTVFLNMGANSRIFFITDLKIAHFRPPSFGGSMFPALV